MSKNTSLAVGSLFVFALGCAPLTSNGEPTREQSAVTTLTSAPAPEPASADSADAVDPSQVEVVEHRVIQPPRSSDDRENRWRQLHVWGEMRNKSSRTLSRITADVLFFDARGKLLATDSIASGTKKDLGDATPGEPISSAVHDVPPGASVPFHFQRNLAAIRGEIASHKIVVRPSRVASRPSRGVVIDMKETVAEMTNPAVPGSRQTAKRRAFEGTIRNDGAGGCRAPKVVVALFAPDGKLWETHVAAVRPTKNWELTLEPGATTTFIAAVPVGFDGAWRATAPAKTWIDCEQP